MKRTLIAMIILLSAVMTASAQTGLEINKIFNGKYSSDPEVTETMISGKYKFLGYSGLDVFCTFKGPAAKYASIVEPLVLADGARALGRNTRYKDGKLHYAFFMLPPVKVDGKKVNRFLYYLNNTPRKGKNIMVLYIEGDLDQEGASGLINTMAKSVK